MAVLKPKNYHFEPIGSFEFVGIFDIRKCLMFPVDDSSRYFHQLDSTQYSCKIYGHSVEITEIYFHALFCKKFRESNVFTKEIAK